MNKIEVLDQNTIDKIAAGEVVERPSSVVKELVENAIDAGASAVTVEITDGGKKLIRITDNGSGIDPSEVRTAFLSHATSKIRKVEDLEHIASLGFRGEALSSIAAVSSVELITRTPSAISGVRYMIAGGQEELLEEIGAPEGTTFLVRNLFYNVPARSKFLKSDMSEGNTISSLMEQLALSHPEISFKYIQNKQVKLHSSGNNNMRDVIYSIYGRDITRSLLELRLENDFMKVSGFIGKPEIARGNRSFENYYINGRYVKDKILAKAIEDGYKGFLMQHKFPFVSLQIEMDGSELDVNVHPSKMEVRFARGVEVYEELMNAVRRTLQGRELIPEVPAGPRETVPPVPPVSRKEIPEPFEARRREALQRPFENKEHREAIQGSLENKEHREPKQEFFERKEVGKDLILSENTALRRKNTPADQEQDRLLAEEQMKAMMEPDNFLQNTQDECPADDTPANEGKALSEKPEQLTLFRDDLLSEKARSRHKLIGQVFDTYWLVQYEENFYIIDQHAAHEKVCYERFVKEFREHTVQTQYISPPMILTLTLEEESILKTNMEYFRTAGFEIESFGGREYALRGVPTDLYRYTEEELFREMLDNLSSGGGKDMLEVIASNLAGMACKAAVKGNHTLSVQEADRLIDELLSLENPYHCPHGRPTIITMTKKELEKKFHRIV